MSTFFDSKQEVIQIELTEWGKYLFSQGRLSPQYYSFSDDGILYDGSFAGLTDEEQKEIEDRVLNQTPYLKQHVRLKEAKDYFEEYDLATSEDVPSYSNPLDSMTSVEVMEKVKETKSKFRYSQDLRTNSFLVNSKLGSLRTNVKKSPKFNLVLLSSELTNVYNTYRDTSYGIVRIPQVNINLECDVGVLYDSLSGPGSAYAQYNQRSSLIPANGLNSYGSAIFEDGTYIVSNPKFLAIDLSEDNVEYDSTNFKVEFFEVVDEATMEIKLLKTFVPIDNVDQDGFYVENQNLASSMIAEQSAVDPDNVNYYFSVQIDSEIPQETICNLVGDLQEKGYNFKLNYDIDCGLYKRAESFNKKISDFNSGNAKSITIPSSDCAGGGKECL
jgi:hypothetical protein